MSRYPGTQFHLVDNTNAAAAVPVQDLNQLAPVYMSTFRAPKGSEDMLTVFGNRFYDMYGSQDKISFNTYKQPLLQASMDINNGAVLIAKRAVLETAKLANATVGIVLTKESSSITLTKETDTEAPSYGYYKTATITTSSVSKGKYVIRPAVVSIKDDAVNPDNLDEKKYLYNIHKDYIYNEIEGSDSFKMDTGATATFTDATGAITYVDLCNGLVDNDTGKYVIDEGIKNGASSNVVLNTTISTASVGAEYTGATTVEALNKAQTKFFNDVHAAAVPDEYFFPLFTIFDNGRGDSLKNISIVFDANTSKTVGKAVYTLKISDNKTGRNLESYAFTINPYSRNNNTGYTFDIESAVNAKSDQIKVKYHYDVYDKLIGVLADNVGTNEYLFDNADVLFGHDLSGKTLPNNLVQVGIGGIDLYSTSISKNSNLDIVDQNTDPVAYYYYDYSTRSKKGITEKLLYGFDGEIDTTIYDKEVVNGLKTATVDDGAIVAADELYNTSFTAISSSSTLPVSLGLKSTNPAQADLIKKNIAAIKAVVPSLNFGDIGDESTVDKLILKSTNGDYKEVSAKVTKIDPANYSEATSATYTIEVTVVSYSWELSYQNQFRKFFNGQFDRDIFNLDVWFPNLVFDANYNKRVKLAIQKLAAYRGDFFAYLDLNTDVKTFSDVQTLIDTTDVEEDLPYDETGTNYYIHDRNGGVTSVYGDIRDPYSNKQITVTATYGLSLAMIKHFINGVGRPFCGQNNGIVFTDFIEGTVNYIPKIYPSSAMVSRSFIGDTYPSDDETIVNEKQQMCDLHVNYGSYYNGLFTMDTQYTLNPTESEYIYINNIMLVHRLMQAIRKACPASRYRFIDSDDLSTYQKKVEEVLKLYRSQFAKLTFRYVQDENSVANKIYYAAIEVVFRPFAQAEIFTITALNYSTLSSDVTSV